MSYFEIYKGSTEWYWRLVSANGRIVADGSEGYSSKENAVRAANRVRKMLQTVTVRPHRRS